MFDMVINIEIRIRGLEILVFWKKWVRTKWVMRAYFHPLIFQESPTGL